MGTCDDYMKSFRSVSINDFGQEVTVRTSEGVTWVGLVELAINAIRGLGYDVPDGGRVIDAIEFLQAEEEAKTSKTIPLEDPEAVDASR